MAETSQKQPDDGPEERLDVDSHGLMFPIHRKDLDDESRLAKSRENLIADSEDKSFDDNRPESAIYGGSAFMNQEEAGADMSSWKMIERLTRRLGRCNPKYAETVCNSVDAITTNVGLQIVVEVSAVEFLLSNYGELIQEDAEHLVNHSSLKIIQEIEQGIQVNDDWEREVDEVENKIKQARGRNEKAVALFNRQQLKELTKIKQLKAQDFSLKMQEIAKEKALKRQSDINNREYTLVVMVRQDLEIEYKKKLDKLAKQHEKAKESLRILQEKKKVRQIDFLQGINRHKKLAMASPFYLQKEHEFKKEEEDRYYSHGRRQSEVEEFLKHKKTYHLLKNKKDLMELLHPERIPSANLTKSPFIRSRLISANYQQSSIKSQTRRLNYSNDLLMIDEDNIKFAQLPKLKFSK